MQDDTRLPVVIWLNIPDRPLSRESRPAADGTGQQLLPQTGRRLPRTWLPEGSPSGRPHDDGPWALVQLNGDNFLFYNKSLGDLNVEKCTHKHPRSVDGVNDVWHAYPHSSRNLHDIGIARKPDWRLYK